MNMSTEDMELPVTALDFLAIQYQNNPDSIPPILEVADTVYAKILTEGRLKRGGIHYKLRTPLAVSISLRVSGRQFSWVPLCRYFEVSARELKPKFLQVSKWKWPRQIMCGNGLILNLPLKSNYLKVDAGTMISHIATRLRKSRYTKPAENLYDTLVGEGTEVTSRQPETVAAVMVYLACNANGGHLSAYQIAEVAGSNITSIYQFSNELKEKFGKEKIKEAAVY
jgi:hypothetical protein